MSGKCMHYILGEDRRPMPVSLEVWARVFKARRDGRAGEYGRGAGVDSMEVRKANGAVEKCLPYLWEPA